MVKSSKIVRFLLVLILIIIANTTFSQEYSKIIKTEFDTLRKNKYAILNDTRLLQLNNELLLDSLSYLHTDSLANIRYNLMLLEYNIIRRNPGDTLIYNKVAVNLINYLLDREAYISTNALSILITFNPNSLNKRFFELFNRNFKKFPQIKNLYVFIGLAKWNSYRKYMLENVNFNPVSSLSDFNSANWGMQLALAMMGNQESITYCINTIKTWPNNLNKYGYLYTDLKYLRNKSCIVFLQKELENTALMPSITVNDKGRNCNFYTIDLLSEMLVNFPITQKKRYYSEAELQQAREWLNKETDYKFK